jgi:hypothetical protein
VCEEGVISDVKIIIYIGKRVRKKGSTNFIAGYGKIFTPRNEKQLAKGFGLMIKDQVQGET